MSPEQNEKLLKLEKMVQDNNLALDLVEQLQQRMDTLVLHLPQMVKEAVEGVISDLPQPTEEEREFLKLAVASEAQRVKLRQAIIEKTVPGLVWAGITITALTLKKLVEEYLTAHGVKLW